MSGSEIDVRAYVDEDFMSTPAQTANLVRMLMRRLKRLVTIRDKCSELLNTEGARLLNKAIYSTYCDCLNMGLGEEARSIIKG